MCRHGDRLEGHNVERSGTMLTPDQRGSETTQDGCMPAASDSAWIVAKAQEIGFDLCGIAKVEAWAELDRLNEWLERGHAGEMGDLHDPRRCDPRHVLPGARSVVVCALNYNTRTNYSIQAA